MLENALSCTDSYNFFKNRCLFTSIDPFEVLQVGQNISQSICELGLLDIFSNCLAGGLSSAASEFNKLTGTDKHNCYSNFSNFAQCKPGVTSANTKSPNLCKGLSYAAFIANESIGLAENAITKAVMLLVTQIFRFLEVEFCLPKCDEKHTFIFLGEQESQMEATRYLFSCGDVFIVYRNKCRGSFRL